MNMLTHAPEGQEDCLVLNVFSPDVAKACQPKPVMVFIHGGAFTMGSGNGDIYGPHRFMNEDIVRLEQFQIKMTITGFIVCSRFL